jgi:hypothetical protein
VCFDVVIDKLKQFEPAHDAVSLNSFPVSNTLNTFTSCKYKKTLDMNLQIDRQTDGQTDGVQ